MTSSKLHLIGLYSGRAKEVPALPRLELPLQLVAVVLAAATLTVAATFATHLGFDALEATSLRSLARYEPGIQRGMFLLFAAGTVALLFVHTAGSLLRTWKMIRRTNSPSSIEPARGA